MSSSSDIFGHGHEEIVFHLDRKSGLRAIIAIYSTALGPALGGTRFYPYASTEEATADVLKLSKAMAYKASVAGLDLGGGKAVIIGDPVKDKTDDLLRAYGRFVESLGGRYYTACDVGTFSPDMDIVSQESQYVTGRSEDKGGAGDSSVLTAFGVYQGMRASAQHQWGVSSLSGKRIGVMGVGKVGRHLVGHLHAEGAEIVISDMNADAISRLIDEFPGVTAIPVDEIVTSNVDVLSPCALGGVLNHSTVNAIQAKIICGGANNQLAEPGIAAMLAERGILYAPDYLVNAGGLIQVDDERHGFDFDRAKARTATIYDTSMGVFEYAATNGLTPAEAADRLAENRMAGR